MENEERSEKKTAKKVPKKIVWILLSEKTIEIFLKNFQKEVLSRIL